MLADALRLPDNLALRPARPADRPFLETLYASTRDDLRLVDGEEEFISDLIRMQGHAQTQGYGEQFPNAWHFVVQRLGEPIGRLVLDFGNNDLVRVVDLAFIPAARGRGYGSGILQAVQQVAAQLRVPVALSVNPLNLAARRTYLRLGFQVAEATPMVEHLIWRPAGDFPANR